MRFYFWKKYLLREWPGSFLVIIFFLAISAFPATLREYGDSLKEAISELDLVTESAFDEEYSESERKEEIRSAIRAVREGFLKLEKVDFDKHTIDTENEWLESKLKEIEENIGEPEKRDQLLNEAINRLEGISKKIEDAENQLSGNRSKDQDKQKLDEILKRDEYRKAVEKKEEEEKSAIAQFWDDLMRRIRDFFRNLFPDPGPSDPSSSGSLSSISRFLQVLVVVVALAILGFVIYRFAPYLFGRKKKGKKAKKERVILGETISADQDAEGILSEAEMLARAGDLRGAIRKGYVALLCDLSDRKLIGLAHHKTNRDYLRDVRKDQALFQNMSALTRSFELHWYGLSIAKEEDWNDFRARYQEAITIRK